MSLLNDEISKSPFKEVAAALEQRELLEDAIKYRWPVTIWTKKKERFINDAILRSYDPALGLELEIPVDSQGQSFIQFVKSQDYCTCYLNFGTIRGGIFLSTNFVTERVSEKRALLSLEYPGEFFKVQRRTNARLPIRPPFLLLVKLRTEDVSHYIQRKVSDISIGGLAMLTTPQEAAFFSRGKSLHEVKFVLRQKSFTTTAEVRHSRVVNEQKLAQLLVGIRFTALDKKDTTFLETFVAEEMQSQFAQLSKLI